MSREQISDLYNDTLEPIIKCFIGQMDSAMRVSDILAKHESPASEEITVDHLITGLVYRLMVPMTNEEVDESLGNAQQILDKLDDTDSEEGSDEECELDQDVTVGTVTFGTVTFGSRKVKTNNCNCDVCMKARVCLLNYESHDCGDPLSDKFKKAITMTCDKHKIYI